LAVGISGPDFAYPQKTKRTIFDWDDPAVAAFDMHDYGPSPAPEWIPPLVEKARGRGIPFFLSELGTWVGDDVNGTPESASGINLGIDGFNRWSFTNRGDLDGQWQLVRTWEEPKWDYLKQVTPEPVPYYAYGILTRFMAKHSSVLKTACDDADVVAAALRSPKGNLTLYVLNRSTDQQPVSLTLSKLSGVKLLHKYQVTDEAIGKDGYQMGPLREFPLAGDDSNLGDVLPAESITVYTTYRLKHDEPGVTTE
jgi:hypothetical protein